MTPRLKSFLASYACPGNIRELRNLVYRVSCLAGDVADIDHLPASVREACPELEIEPGSGQAQLGSLVELKKAASRAAERQFLEQGLTQTNGKVVELARRCGLNRSHVQCLMKKHGLSAMTFEAVNFPTLRYMIIFSARQESREDGCTGAPD